MSIIDEIRKLRRKETGTPPVEQKSPEEEKAEKLALIAQKRQQLHKEVGNKPFEMGLRGSEYGMETCIYLDNHMEGDTRKLTIVNPIYQFDTPDTFKLIGARMFERIKGYGNSELDGGAGYIIKETDIKRLTADEFRQLKEQQLEKTRNAVRHSRS